jgi:hypothetical protein
MGTARSYLKVPPDRPTGCPVKGTSATDRHCHDLPTWVCATKLTDLMDTWTSGSRPPSAAMIGAAGAERLL